MTTEWHRFKLGDFECTAISDGSVNYPLQNLFANVPKAQVEGTLRQRGLPTDYVTTPFTCLHVSADDRRVLVDTGAGRAAPNTGRLPHNLRAASIEPADVDTVIITHAHPGHIGGALDDAGERVYINARYFIWDDEWKFWTSEVAKVRAPERHVAIARRSLEALQDRLTLVDRECEIVPGIRALAATGHTPGHIVVSVSSGDGQLLYASDTVYHPVHLEHADWLPIYDIVPEKAAASKCRVFDWAAEQESLVIGQHFPPFPSLGRVAKRGEGWQWQPVET